MFGKIGQIASMLRNLPKLKEEAERFQQQIQQITAEGDAGAGMVKVRVNGRFEMVACHLSEEVLQSPDREMLEELIRAATNQAVERVRQKMNEESAKMFAGMGLPDGMGFPGIV